MIYSVLIIVPLSAFLSLAIDWGHYQLVRTQLQNASDASALGIMDAYIVGGWNAATTAAVTYPADNIVDAGAGVLPTTVVTGGSWNVTTRTFTPNNFTGTPAVRVQMSRTRAANNPLKLFWGSMIGRSTIDVRASAIAILGGGNSAPVTIPSRAALYLAGMPAGATTEWGDNATNAAPYQVVSIPVSEGQWLSFSNFSGTSSIYPAGGVGYYDAAGNSAMPLRHGQNYNNSPNSPGPENGIADACIPASAVTGLFLSDSVPSTTPAPAAVDWTDPTIDSDPVVEDLATKQPFKIGNGKNASGTVKKFRVPAGATRMFLAIWDGVMQSNNGGTVSGTVTRKQYAYLVS